MKDIKFTSALVEVISLLMAQGIRLPETDKIIIDDFKRVIGDDAVVTVSVTDEEVILFTEVESSDSATVLKLREAAEKDGFAFSAVFNTVTLKTDIAFKLPGNNFQTQQKEPTMANEQTTANEPSLSELAMMIKGISGQLGTLATAQAQANDAAVKATESANAAAQSAIEAKAAAASIREEMVKNAEAMKVSDTRNSSILAQLQQGSNQAAEKKEESFFDTTAGQVTMWGGGAVALGLVGYAAYTYLGGGGEATVQ